MMPNLINMVFMVLQKIRGTFANVDESDQRALELIQKHDSVHKIYHVKVGTPFRLCILKSLLIMPLLLMKSMSKQMLKMKYLDL